MPQIIRSTIVKFLTKVLIKSSMNVQLIHKILVNFWKKNNIHEHIFQILIIIFINTGLLAKPIKYFKILQ